MVLKYLILRIPGTRWASESSFSLIRVRMATPSRHLIEKNASYQPLFGRVLDEGDVPRQLSSIFELYHFGHLVGLILLHTSCGGAHIGCERGRAALRLVSEVRGDEG